ncbi:MAG: ATP-binding protein [Candidatus Kapaibacterium sp.]
MKRKIINIDEEKCNGCGLCIPECKEGALQIIDGKARLISDLFCDGLGACIGHCPEDAITIEERDTEPYDERKVMDTLLNQPRSVMKAHLEHLIDHGATEYYDEAIEYLKEKGIPNPVLQMGNSHAKSGGSCPGTKMMSLSSAKKKANPDKSGTQYPSQLGQWPVQLHLVSPNAPYFKDQELVIMSTCGPLASANVHEDYLAGRAVVVACPKLDYTDPYTEKLASIFANSRTPKAIVVRMEVPCCGGLTQFALNAAKMSGADVEIEEHVMAVDGSLKSKNILYSPEKETVIQ